MSTRTTAQTLAELERKHVVVLERGRALRRELGAMPPLLWLGAGVLAGALAGRMLPRRGLIAKLAPFAAMAGAAEAWVIGAMEPLVAHWRERAGAARDDDPPAPVSVDTPAPTGGNDGS